MKIINRLVFLIGMVLFLIPFFWLESGFMDLGGDGGRLYFVDPLAVVKNIWNLAGSYIYSYADIGYFGMLTVLKKFVQSPTHLISVEHGLELSLSFMGMYLIVKTFLQNEKKRVRSLTASIVGIVAGFVYVSLVTKVGWPVALITLHQVFLNVVIFYLLLRYCLSKNYAYILTALFLSVIFSSNFGFVSIPQLLSFYPAAFLFLYIYLRFVVRKQIPWKGLIVAAGLFLGLHAFHLLPVIASLLNRSSSINTQVFNKETIQNSGVSYFAANHAESGKISRELFQSYLGQNLFGILVPIITLLGFFSGRSKLLSLTGIFFAMTLFLVAANITRVGVNLYQTLFYIPGFMMFRSFNEKWHFVFAFFYTLVFAVSLHSILERKKFRTVLLVSFSIIVISVYRMIPFLSGKTIHAIQHQSKNVSTVFSPDPDLLEAVNFVRNLPDDGKVLTVPLTFPFTQVAYGRQGGAYVGISWVSQLAGRQDFSGFWAFGPYERPVFDAIRSADTKRLIQLLSLLNVRYIFRNSDPRIMDNFPGYPYVYGGMTYATKDDLPAIKDQAAYNTFLASLPVEKIYQKEFYEIYKVEDAYVRPLIYIPDAVTKDVKAAIVSSFRSASVDALDCSRLSCDGGEGDALPTVNYTKRNAALFDIVVDAGERKTPFLLVLSHPYYSPWKLSLDDGGSSAITDHIVANGYANGWIIDPTKVKGATILRGRIYLTSRNYLYVGAAVSAMTLLAVIVLTFWQLWRKKYERT